MSKLSKGFHCAITGLLILSAGCTTVQEYSLTYKLWNNPQLRRFAEPAPDPHLALFAGPPNNDALVQYDEIREQDDVVGARGASLRLSRMRGARSCMEVSKTPWTTRAIRVFQR